MDQEKPQYSFRRPNNGLVVPAIRISRRDFLSLAGISIGAALLATCTPKTLLQATQTPILSPTPVEKSTIEIWYYPGDTWKCVIDGPVADFNAQSETVRVEGLVKSQELRDEVRPALAAGVGPDILVPFGPALIPELVNAGSLLPLDSFAQQYNWDKNIVPWALELGRVDGVLYALPSELETFVLWYNKTLFDKKGWKLPATMAELSSLCETIQADGIIPFAGGTGDCKACHEWYVGEFMDHIAGPEKVYQALQGSIPFSSPEFVESIATWNEMMQKGWWMGGVDRFFTTTFDEFSAAFASGEAAMNLEGSWFPGRAGALFEEAGQEYDWVPFPSKSGAAIYSVGIGSIRAINKNSKHPDAAAEWLTYEYSPEVQARMFVDCGLSPAPVKLDVSMLEGADPRLARLFADFAKAQAEGNYGYTTYTFWSPNSEAYLYEEIQKVLTNDLTVEAYLEGLDKVFTEDLKAGLRPPLPKRL